MFILRSQWLHSHFVFSLDPYKIYIVNTNRDFSLCNIWYFLYIWKVTFECVWALEVKYVFTAIPKKPCWRAPKCFEPLINDKLPQPPPPPPPPTSACLFCRGKAICSWWSDAISCASWLSKKVWKKRENKQKGGGKKLAREGHHY